VVAMGLTAASRQYVKKNEKGGREAGREVGNT
jgi:hypothetical protein